ncbi:N-carbamoylsarcosine amidohydrolase [Acinetobacter rathckeae]|nr:N-carbamoylsarcosine amidohydrolase [Acinetobacter rathckeae]
MPNQSAQENYQGVWGNRIGYGEKPAFIVIDFMQGYTTQGEPLYAKGVVDAVKQTQPVLEAVRNKDILVIHTNILYQHPDQLDGGIWVKKSPVMRAMTEGNPAAKFCEEVQPREGEIVLTKNYASAFFGTNLASTLHSAQIDTVILVGCSTSGCIRATAVDAVQHGFRTIVIKECVGDRHQAPHEANLFDIDSKYGDVVTADSFYEYLNQF